jgi:membrane protein implicated in regulation of membrane protease activity
MILASTFWEVRLVIFLAIFCFLVWVVANWYNRRERPKFRIGQEVRWLTTGQHGKVLQAYPDDQLYTIEFAKDEIRVLHEDRLE